MKLSEIAEAAGCTLDGDGTIDITGVATLMDAQPGQISFLTNKKYQKHLATTRASAVIVHESVPDIGRPALRCKNPYLAFAQAADLFYQAPEAPVGIHPTAVIAESAHIGDNAAIGAYVVIGERVTIGDNAIIHPHTVIYHDVTIGDDFTCHAHVVLREKLEIGNRVLLQSCVVIGADGFGFAPRGDGFYHKIPQAGSVKIGDDVEIQSISSVDRGTLEVTDIGQGVKVGQPRPDWPWQYRRPRHSPGRSSRPVRQHHLRQTCGHGRTIWHRGPHEHR